MRTRGSEGLISAKGTAQCADQPATDHQKTAERCGHRKECALRQCPQGQVTTKEKRSHDDERARQSGEACGRTARQRNGQRRVDEREKGSCVQCLAIAAMSRNGRARDTGRAQQACKNGQDSVGQAEKVIHGITRFKRLSGSLLPSLQQGLPPARTGRVYLSGSKKCRFSNGLPAQMQQKCEERWARSQGWFARLTWGSTVWH